MTKATRDGWDSDQTIIRPTAAAVRRAALAAEAADVFADVLRTPESEDRAPAGWAVDDILRSFRLAGEQVPTMVASAAPLLNLAHVLRTSSTEPDMGALREATVAAIKSYERDLAGARISPDRARSAHYVVCATIDDVVLSKPWGIRGGWTRNGLVSTFHMDVTSGDRVFELLDHFHRNPGASRDILLLIYLCLSLAFEGRTRVSPRGTLELGQIREGLYRTLRGQFGDFERELSPHWRGVAARHKPLKTGTLLWTLLSGLALFFALGYLGFTLALNRSSDETLARLAAAAPQTTPSLAAAAPADPQPVVEKARVGAPIAPSEPEATKPAEVEENPLDTFLAFLKPEVDQGLVSLTRDDGTVLVRLSDSGLFNTGSARVNQQFRDLLNRIGGALAAEKFKAVVIGHTDNVPIRRAQYPSNWHLSEARAKAVADILSGFAGAENVTFEGRAETEPLQSNDTPEGREANRRTEILVLGEEAQAGFRRRSPAGQP